MFDDWDTRTWTGFLIIGIVPIAIMWLFGSAFHIPLLYKIVSTIGLPLIAWFFIDRKKK